MLRNSAEELRLLTRCLLERAALVPSDDVCRDFVADAMHHFARSITAEPDFRTAWRETLRLRKKLQKESRTATCLPPWYRRKILNRPLWLLWFTVRHLWKR